MTDAAIASYAADSSSYSDANYIGYAFDVVDVLLDIAVSDASDTTNDSFAVTVNSFTDKYCPDELCDAGDNTDSASSAIWTDNTQGAEICTATWNIADSSDNYAICV